MTRNQIAVDLMADCPPGAMQDHKLIAMAILEGSPIDEILNMKQVNAWPDTYVFIRDAVIDEGPEPLYDKDGWAL